MLAVLFSACIFFFSSCVSPYEDLTKQSTKTEENKPVSDNTQGKLLPIYGIWESSYGEKFDITRSFFKNYYNTDVETYTGNTVTVRITNSTSGYVYFKYTKSIMPDWSYSTSAPDVGKWYAVSYKNLTATSVKLAGAYKSDGRTSCATLEEAIEEFTIENGYYEYYSDCVKTASVADKDVNLTGTTWFVGDTRIDFPTINETLYLNYFADGTHSNRWVKLSPKGNTGYEAEIIWSTTIREIGRKSDVTIGIDNSGKLMITSEFLNLTGLETYQGVTAREFNPNNIPALSADYFSNFTGTYNLNSTNCTLHIAAKLNISQDTTHYWNANILNTTYNEQTKTYDLLLAHSSQANASGSIDPGITGQEPFISQQGLFWSHLTLTAEPGSQWRIKWSSVWKNSPYEALNTTLDMEDTFTGPATTVLTYTYNFYFGNPKLENGWYTVDRGSLIHTASFTSAVPVSKTWGDILTEYSNYISDSNITFPDGKMKDYWWYSTNSITGIESSYVYTLNNSTSVSLTEYNFYLALKDRPTTSGTVFIPENTYTPSGDAWAGYSLTVSGNHCVLTYPDGSKEFDVVPDLTQPNYQDFPDENYPNLRIFYNLSNKYRVKLYKTSRSSTTLIEWNKQ